ncbi:HNH endonuclease [Erwinia psidii]|uniref:HNH endonuclease signature motif containing protein n=1 Tax=Erwinia psidii TaxID=69224 RepID=UPI00226B6EAC|nr:HNH endonuclease [Erwinia psidii]MCX8967056.1 HNH endonuclease [Erwinia psidii]
MLRLYTLWELERELSPDEFQHILAPDAALEKATFAYELDYRNYISPPANEAPRLLATPKDKPYIRSEYNPVYDALEMNLMEGWIIGLDTDEHWDDTVNPFHINTDGELIFDGVDPFCWVISDFQRAYRIAINNQNGRKPAATEKFRPSGEPAQHAQAGKTINSKAAGRLLAAGGIYNGNIEGFRQTAEQLGGDAVKGYDGVLNETTSGLMVAAASLLVIRNPLAAEELTSYLGKYKKAHVLLDDMNVTQLNYLRRDRAEYNALRGQFNNTVRPNFLKSLSSHPDALSTFDSNDLLRLANGNVPSGWQVHHKIPLDDGGTNALDNLILIQNSPYHSALSKTQAIITKDLPYNASTEVLWPSPNGVIYPVGK